MCEHTSSPRDFRFFVRLPPRGGSVGDGGGACEQNEIRDNLKFTHSPSVALRRHLPPQGGFGIVRTNLYAARVFVFLVVGEGQCVCNKLAIQHSLMF